MCDLMCLGSSVWSLLKHWCPFVSLEDFSGTLVIGVVLLALMVKHSTLQSALMFFLSTVTGYYCWTKLQSYFFLSGQVSVYDQIKDCTELGGALFDYF